MKDVEVLSRLRHHAIVGGHSKEHQVHSVGARQHVSYEPLMTGDVHNPRSFTMRQIEKGKAQIDRNAARLFFLKAIGILSSESLDETGLAVIDMSGGSNDPVHVLRLRSRRVRTLDRCATEGSVRRHWQSCAGRAGT